MKQWLIGIVYSLLRNYAQRVIRQHKPIVIAVTGSVGKSSTKEALYRVLHDEYGDSVRKNYGNLNTEIGVPLTILGYESLPTKWQWPMFLVAAGVRSFTTRVYPKYLVLEMGIEKVGDMRYLATIAPPDYAVITSLAGAHLANFAHKGEYHREKLSITRFLKPGGRALINADDIVMQDLRGEKFVRVAIDNNDADFHAAIIRQTIEETEYRISSTGHKITIKSKLLGRHMVYPSLFAFALASNLGISLLRTGKSLEKLRTLPGRLNVLAGRGGVMILDDTYNANPASVKAALDLLSQLDHPNRKLFIMGNMNELGSFEKGAHQEIGGYARGKCDLAIFVGKNAKTMQNAYGDESSSKSFSTRKELVESISSLVKSGDLVLVKASQNGNYFEEVVKQIMANPEKASDLLVRQSKGWLRKKK